MKRLWQFFSSITLTIALSLLICAVSAWGSILAVRHPAFYRSLDSSVLFPRLLAGGAGGAGELRFTLWIYILVALSSVFAVNTAVCTADRVYSVLRRNAPLKALLPHIVHAGFIVALLGHLAGSLGGFRSTGNVLFKGAPVPVDRTNGLSIRLDGFEMKQSPEGEIESLRTRVTIIEGSKEALTGDITINGPLIYRGIAFYHAGEGMMPSGLDLEAGGERLSLDFYSSAVLKDGARLTLGKVFPDFRLDRRGEPYSVTDEFRNPHIEVIIEGRGAGGGGGGGGVSKGYLDIGSPGGSVTVGAKAIRLADYVIDQYVVVNASKDNGIWLIIAGSVILTGGMVLLLFSGGEKSEIVRGGRGG